MTLIISVLTHEAVLQASDRRLVWVEPNGSTRLRNDNRNKAVMLGQRMFFAYTGIADIGVNRELTDLWLAKTLGELVGKFDDQADLLEALAARATERFGHGRLRNVPLAQRGHEFAIVGWARFPSSPNLKSYFALVTNTRAVDGTFLPEPTDDFRRTWFALQPEMPGRVFQAGIPITGAHEQAMLTDIAAAAPDLKGMGAVLIHQVRRAAEGDSRIGRGVLLNCLPRSAAEASGTRIVMAGPIDGVATCFYVDADDTDPRQYTPIIVSFGGMVMHGGAGPAGSIFPQPQRDAGPRGADDLA